MWYSWGKNTVITELKGAEGDGTVERGKRKILETCLLWGFFALHAN